MKLVDFNNYRVTDKTILTFGNFDGIHLGHDKVINKLLDIAKKNKLKSVLIIFNPHTRSITDSKKNSIITPYPLKIDLLIFNI